MKVLPFSRVRDLEHGLTSLVHQVQGIKRIEIDAPSAVLGRMAKEQVF
jgi:hypothetical protein